MFGPDGSRREDVDPPSNAVDALGEEVFGVPALFGQQKTGVLTLLHLIKIYNRPRQPLSSLSCIPITHFPCNKNVQRKETEADFQGLVYNLFRMIIRANRSQSRFKGQQHRKFQSLIEDLQQQNKDLRLELIKMQQRLLQAQVAKRKYKGKYRQAKQKIEILGLVKLNHHKSNDPYDLCMSPKTKTTRIKTISQEEFNSIKHGFGSDFQEQIETKVEIDHYQTHFSSKKGNTAPSTMREIEQEKEKDSNNEKILENLLKLHEQLEKLSVQIEQKPGIEQRVVALQTQLYRKMEEVVEKVSKLELRDIERQNKRISHEKDKASRKYIQSMKTIQLIGKDLLEFKVGQ